MDSTTGKRRRAFATGSVKSRSEGGRALFIVAGRASWRRAARLSPLQRQAGRPSPRAGRPLAPALAPAAQLLQALLGLLDPLRVRFVGRHLAVQLDGATPLQE